MAETVTSGFNYREWYQKNKQALSAKRKAKYHSDPAYRQRAIENSRMHRQHAKPSVQDGFAISFTDAAEQLGVTVWTLREWRRKNYFPEPKRRDGRLWFNAHQLSWMGRLKEFFAHKGRRVTEKKRGELEALTSLVYANWN